MSAAAGLPAYSGPGRPCPGCGMAVVLTEYHPAAVLWPHEMAGHRPPCADLTPLARPAGRGQHLCRLCLNCGRGWPEACAGHGAAVPPPAVCVIAAAFASSLTATVAASIACLLLAGPARVAAWCVIVVTATFAAGAGYALLTALHTRNPIPGTPERSLTSDHQDQHRAG